MVEFTPEQRAAIEDRSGPALLAASAGSGKTAVMVERFAEAVIHDGVPVGSILALTFTEKAAAELGERLRRRLTELGRPDAAREAEGAWVGTIHGFCARVLAAHPFAAGLDPRFAVLDELAARRLQWTAWDRAVEGFAAEHGAPAVDLLAAYGQWLRDSLLATFHALRSRGERAPALPLPRPAPAPDAERAALAAAREEAARALEGANGSPRVEAGREALEACAAVLAAGDAVPLPTALDAAELGSNAKALTVAACDAYRAAWVAYRQACADHHARAQLVLLDALLRRFGTEYAAAKAARAGVDFEDLELNVRDLLADPALRERWAGRFALIMVDEFQDTNRLQLDVLEALERDNLFAVGDELQSIYGFRHADVTIFRERRARLGEGRTRRLTRNFRAHRELLDVLDAAFAPIFGPGFAPLVAGREEPAANGDGELRLFDPDRPAADAAAPPVELLVTDCRGWDDPEVEPALRLVAGDENAWRRAEARLLAQRVREEVDGNRPRGDIVVLVRATASLRLLEQALEEQGVTTYVVGGRGYWSQEQVRDGLAWLSVLANPRDEAALYAVLASPFAGVGSDGLILAARAGRESGKGTWAALLAAFGSGADADWIAALPAEDRDRLAALVPFLAGERRRAPRLSAELLMERAIAHTGYDVATLARAGGERRLANLRKLMRLAREFERAEGRDLRGFLDFAATQDLAQAREGEAALESEGLDAVRLMTIHRAKGLEFPVVCVADLGRLGNQSRERVLVAPDGRVGLRMLALGSGEGVPALDHAAIAAELDAAEAEEERRLFWVAATRAKERLILSGGIDLGRWPAPRPGGAPLTWLARALAGDPPAIGDEPETVLTHSWDGRAARVQVRVNSPATLGTILRHESLRAVAREEGGAPEVAAPEVAAPEALRVPEVAPVPSRLSYSALQDYARCPYRFYLRRIAGLPNVPAPPAPEPPEDRKNGVRPLYCGAGLDPLLRGSLAHVLLERLDFADPAPPDPEEVQAVAAAWDAVLTDADVEDVRAVVAAFAGSPLCARLAAARSVRREAPFAFALDAGPLAGTGPLVNGIVDVVAREADGTTLIVDYKSDRLAGADPAELVERDYGTQRLVYALAGLREGAARVEVAHCLLETPETMISAVYGPADASALVERLAGLAGGVLAARYPVTDQPHRELCGTCPGRAALCSHPESLTLRDPAQASAGTFSGNGGPS